MIRKRRLMLQSTFIESDGSSEPAIFDPEQVLDDGHHGSRRASVQARTAVLRTGLAAWLLMLALAAPSAALHPGADVTNRRGQQHAGMVPTHGTCSRLTIPVATSVPPDVLFRRRDLQYRRIERQLLERRYAQLRHAQRRHSKVRRLHHPALDSFNQYQRWLAVIDGGESGIALLRLTPRDSATAFTEQPNDVLIGEATLPAMPDVSFTSTASGLPAKGETGALALSGGSIADTGKVTVDADGGLQIYFKPNWSLIAKFDGEIRPQPQLSAGSATLNYNW
jgi:hypothetical protein